MKYCRAAMQNYLGLVEYCLLSTPPTPTAKTSKSTSPFPIRA
jgi:hypothetical protein